MDFTIIVPFLNEEKYIKSCLESLINLTFPKNKYEIIFIDNGSTDNSAEIVKGYNNVRLLLENKPNPYNARNMGLKYAKGKLIAFTDADCVVDKNWLQNSLEIFKDSKICAILGERNFPNKNSTGLQVLATYENCKIDYIVNQLSTQYFVGYTNNLIIRKQVFDEIGLFKINLPINGDIEFIHRILNKYSRKSIVYSSRLKILHQEINTSYDWFKKMYRYGYHNTSLQNISQYCNLPLNINLKIFQSLSSKQHYNLWRKFCAILILLSGFVAYRIGSIQAKLFSRLII